MLKINKIYMMIAIIFTLNGCTTFSDYYNDYYAVTVNDDNYNGIYERKIATNDEYFTSGQFYKDNIEKLQKYDIDINSIAGSGVTVYDLDAKIVMLEPVNNRSYENIDNIMQTKIELVPPSDINRGVEGNNAITIFSLDGEVIQQSANKRSEVPDLLPPMDRGNSSYPSPFKGDNMDMSGKPKNLLTK